MKQLLITIAICAVLLLPILIEAAPAPGIPHQFYGSVNFSNGPAPDGLVVEARIGGQVAASASIVDGKYGYSPNLFFVTDPNNDRQGESVHFFVSGIDTAQTTVFINGGYSEKDLTIAGSVGTIEMGEDEVIENETVAVAPSTSAFTNIKVGGSLNVTISSNVSTNATIEKIQKLESGNVAVFSGKNLLNAYEIKVTSEEDITISVTMSYNDNDIDENTIAPYYFDGTNWVEITSFTIDKSANTVTFEIEPGGTPYAVFGTPSTPAPSTGGGGGGGGTTSIPPATPISLSEAAKKMDTNLDDRIDVLDFNSLMVNWGREEGGNIADFDDNGRVDIFDFNLLMIYWTG